MHTIIVEKECGCFRRSALENNISMDSKDDALLRSLDMVHQMNREFCGKHEFSLVESGADFLIQTKESHSHSCCGGGCGH